MDDNSKVITELQAETTEVGRFADSYASFNRIINSLQRKYIELKDEFSTQNEELVQANRKLVALSAQNIRATEFLNGVLESITAGVIAVDSNGRITHFNPAASLILGIPRNEPPGKLYRDVILPGDPSDANALRSVETGRAHDAVEKKVELKDGSWLHLSVSTAIIRDHEGVAVGAVEVFHDLTKMKKMEQELTRLNTLAALGEMAATIAHQVRNPLAAIGGFASLLDRDLPEGDRKKELVSKMIRGVKSLNDTVETLLGYTRTEELSRSEVDYHAFIQATIDQFKVDNAARLDGFSIAYGHDQQTQPATGKVSIDRMLFRQIFFNILTNAVDACKDGGAVKIETKTLNRASALARYGEKLMLGVDETVLETVITDNGPGVDAEHINHIFSPFYTTRREGTGLGLAVAWKIMKAHGGDIRVENVSEGTGAAFYLLLPIPVNSVCVEQQI
jgi:PAS domain S-box-containing protein